MGLAVVSWAEKHPHLKIHCATTFTSNLLFDITVCCIIQNLFYDKKNRIFSIDL